MRLRTASDVVQALLGDAAADKLAAVEHLAAERDSTFEEQVRLLLLHHLERPDLQPDHERAGGPATADDTRAWLLSALGRVAASDPAAREKLAAHVDPDREPFDWARYWALEGAFVGNPGLASTLASAAADDPSSLVRCLALAILAHGGDRKALVALREALPEDPWACLRALRIAYVSDHRISQWLLSTVREGSYSDTTYDAIMALGEVPPDAPELDDAVEALTRYVRKYRWPMYDSMRTSALIALGRLRSPLTVPALMRELTDPNPMIVLQASRALEASIGSSAACRRVVEAAMQSDDAPRAFASALRAMDRGAVLQALESSARSGKTREEEAALELLTELGGAETLDRLAALRRTTEQYVAAQSRADDELRASLEAALVDARRGFAMVTAMDGIVFLGGLVVLGVGGYLTVTGEDPTLQLAGAVTSATGLFAVVMKNWLVGSRDRIEPSVRRLASLQATFHGYLRQLRQVDQAYTQHVLSGRLAPADVAAFSAIVEQATDRAVAALAGTEDGRAEVAPASDASP